MISQRAVIVLTADFAGSMVIGFVASLVFVLACWLGLRREWGFPASLGFAGGIWLAIAFLPRWVGLLGDRP